MKTLFIAIATVLFTAAAHAAQYNYMVAGDLEKRVRANEDLVIVDIQVEDEFNQHHIPGALATYAYPVKSTEERARLTPVVELQRNDSRTIVIVCPRGAGGAKRTYDYFVENGIAEERLFILEKGMSGWNSADLTAARR